MRSHDGYDPENTLQEIRLARGTRRTRKTVKDKLFAEILPIADRAAAHLCQLWPDPREREMAGFGALAAAAVVAQVIERGDQAVLINLMGLLGQALVDDARAEVARA